MGRNDIRFAASGRLDFDQYLMRQADDGRTGPADKTLTDTDFIGAVRFDDANGIVFDDDQIIPIIRLDRNRIRSLMT